MLFIWACLIQSCGLVDNHHISVVHEQSPGNRSIESLDTRINQWLDRNSTSDSHAETNCPYAFFISAEGGGIRASAWTALVLARLEREVGDARFADCIVSGSGVSGGSLGLAAFVAGRKVLNVSATSGNDEDSLDGRLQRMLEADFISPLVTVAFTTDQLQRIVPGVRLTDRGTALESAFSGAFEEAFSTGKHLRQDVVQSFANPFREAFTSLYNTTMPSETLWNWTPILLLNTTDVRSGERVIQAGLPLPSGMDMEKDFPAAMDGNCAMGNGVSLVGAIHNSARFAYVSPAGNSPCQPRRQVVDGGYFENSGATTSYDMLKLYLRLADRKPHQVSPKPVVIHISNDVSLASFDQQTGEQEHCPNEDEPNHPYGEIIPPPLALYRTRSAHGQHARLLLRQTMREIANQNEPDSACSTEKGSCFFFFALGYHDQCRGFPLGWQIGRSSMCEMLRQRDGQGANAKTFGRFEDLFVGSGSQYETRLCHDSSTQARP